MNAKPVLNLGAWRRITGAAGGSVLRLPAHHLVTHGVVVGMTGSGKTGLLTVMAEEALSAGVPTLIIDIKGDLPNLLLTQPSLSPDVYLPWVTQVAANSVTPTDAALGAPAPGAAPDPTPLELAAAIAFERRVALERSQLDESDLARFHAGTYIRVLTPGATSGEPLHVLSALERRSARWDSDPEASRSALSAAVSLVLRLLGRDADPAKSKEHVLLSVLAERRLQAGQEATLAVLMQDVLQPPITEVGALPINDFLRKADRQSLAASLNTLLAAPTFATWRQGVSLDIAEWFTPKNGRTPAVIVSVGHLDDEERALVLGVLLEEILSWVRGLAGSQQLKALVIFDEVYGFLPPHPKNPPTKRPLVALMKQARAFGVGVIVATQNPMDLDYRALSNAGLWCIGRLQTEADRARVIDGLGSSLSGELAMSGADLGRTIQRLANRWFVVRNAHVNSAPLLLQPRYALSWLRGPMTRQELKLARELREVG